MNLVKSVFEISELFMKDSTYVELDYEAIERTADKMKKLGVKPFPKEVIDDEFKQCLIELVASSINYCYWYGNSSIRPQDCRSSKMYDQVNEAFKFYTHSHSHLPNRDTFVDVLQKLASLLALNRFPMLEERVNHIGELAMYGESFVQSILGDSQKTECADHLENLVASFPGFASDQFLKRASLFFLQLYRKMGWFEPSMFSMHVPADYQVPKVLEYEGCIKYTPELKTVIDQNIFLPKTSQPECEIRAATVLSCKELMKKTGWNVSEIDGWFWLGSKNIDGPFHLCVTTDY